MPALGGSVIITSGLPWASKKASSHILITSPAKKAVSVNLFKLAFILASSIASSTTSTPIIFLAFLLQKIPMLPVPHYKS
jgi:hypothetical protein